MLRFDASVFLLFTLFALLSSGHSHEHKEPPHYKYSKEANVERSKVAGVHLIKQNLRTESAEQLWLETFGSVLLISLAPFFLLCILPDLNKYPNLLKIFLAFAAGGLLGDAFLHLIPHAVDSGHDGHHEPHDKHEHAHNGDEHNHKHDHDHKHHMLVGLSVVSGIFVFLCIEKLIRLFHHHGHRGHSHAAPAAVTAPSNAENKNKKGKKAGNVDDASQKRDKKPTLVAREFRVAGYLNLAADFTHNFTDGLAIGASFLMSRNLGIMTTLTVLIHELPHEIGDYAILIQSGCSARKAMFLQLSTALGAACGAALSLLAAGVGFGSLAKFDVPLLTEELITGCVLPFTAGGFIYIAMTSVLPDLLNSGEELGVTKRPSGGVFKRVIQSIGEVLSLVTGIAMMVVLGSME